MGKSSGSQTVVQTPDKASQGYINQMRQAGQAGHAAAMGGGPMFTGPLTQTPGEMAQAFMNPYMDTIRGEYDRMRLDAGNGANAEAAAAGAFGGSRHGILAAQRLQDIDRSQGMTVANMHGQAMNQGMQFAEHQRQLRERQLQEPMFRHQMAMNFMNLGMGPVGTSTTQTQTPANNPFGSALGGAMAGSSFGPWGAGIGAGIGLLGGLFS